MALKDEILGKIIQRCAEIFKVDPATINADTKFTEDLKAKSVNLVQIIAILEDGYDVQINFMDFRRRKTLGEAADFVAQLRGG